MNYEKIAKAIGLRFKFEILKRYFAYESNIRVLDVGAGNHSASIFKLYYPHSYYTGVDRTKDYIQDSSDFLCMDEFIQIDLSSEDVEEKLKNKKYDLIIMSHIIEHLENGMYVIEQMIKHLDTEGIIYIEWPSERSISLPKGKYPTLNFYDDETHVRIYPLYEICNLLKKLRMKFCEGGVRRHKKEILLIPLTAIYSIKKRKRISGSVFWDLCGFSDYVVFKK